MKSFKRSCPTSVIKKRGKRYNDIQRRKQKIGLGLVLRHFYSSLDSLGNFASSYY